VREPHHQANNFGIIHLNLFVLILKSVSHKTLASTHTQSFLTGKRYRVRSTRYKLQDTRYRIQSTKILVYVCRCYFDISFALSFTTRLAKCFSVIIQSVVSISRRSLQLCIYYNRYYFYSNTWGQVELRAGKSMKGSGSFKIQLPWRTLFTFVFGPI